jgi:hypothetical protein
VTFCEDFPCTALGKVRKSLLFRESGEKNHMVSK